MSGLVGILKAKIIVIVLVLMCGTNARRDISNTHTEVRLAFVKLGMLMKKRISKIRNANFWIKDL